MNLKKNNNNNNNITNHIDIVFLSQQYDKKVNSKK